MNKPGFFIVGAPKCGTTALAKYLGEHDDIFMSNPKEPHYFATNFDDSMRATHTEKHYLSLFKNATNKQLCGEASVWYLYSQEAIANLAKFKPDAKIIIMLRNPIEMIYSLHSQKIHSRDEDVLDFDKAWELSWEREQGNHIPDKCREPKTILYHKVANYSEQIENVYKYFNPTQVKIILFDDFKKDNLLIYKEVLEFLKVPYDGRTNFKKQNENKVEKNKLIGDFFARPPKSFLLVANKIKSKFGIGSFGIWGKLRSLNNHDKKREEINDILKKKILKNCENDMNNLEQYIEKEKLVMWKK